MEFNVGKCFAMRVGHQRGKMDPCTPWSDALAMMTSQSITVNDKHIIL